MEKKMPLFEGFDTMSGIRTRDVILTSRLSTIRPR